MFDPYSENGGWRGSETLRSRNERYALIPSQTPKNRDYELSFQVSLVIVRVQSSAREVPSTTLRPLDTEYDLFEMFVDRSDDVPRTELPQLISELESYADLPANWDFEGAQKPRERAVQDALTFLEKFPEDLPLPYPEVGSDGDVGIYWDNRETHTFAQVVFDGDGSFTYVAIVKKPGCERVSFGGEDLPVSSAWPQDLTNVIRLSPGKH